MTNSIYDELLKWKKELEDEVKMIDKNEQEHELRVCTLMKKIEILEATKNKLHSDEHYMFEEERIKPLREELDPTKKDLEGKKIGNVRKKEELNEIINTLEVQIDLYESIQ
ncbi:hypothetical protein [Bacillus cereus]|uniref:hypothetical protein n=1 Tax=Bacillus cereus TaxID=1396 RepID=UPI0009430A2D|nr:hypothetical protein [Bacillus cereus]